MKVLLINPPLTAKEQARDFEAAVNVLPPLGIAYIAAVLEQDGFEVSIIDSLVMRVSHSWIRELMEREKPEMVGIAATILQVESADLVGKNAKEVSPNSVVIIGGPHVATMPERVVREGKYYDLGVTGEAEYTFREIARKIRSKDFNFEGVQGCYAKKKNGEISFGGVRPYIMNLSELPFPARHLLPPLHVYTPSPITYRKFPVGTMMSCYDEDTEILTENGWKLFKDLLPTDRVASLNPENDTINYERPKHFTKTHFEGNLIHFKSKHVNLLVTKNHNMYVNLKPNRGFKQNDQNTCLELLNDDFKLIPAEQIVNRYKIEFKKNGAWLGKEEEVFILLGIDDKPQKEIPMDLWLEFFGYWIAEGNANKKSNNRYIVKITQIDLYNRLKISACIQKLGYNFYSNAECFEISNKQLYMYLKQFGKHYEKFIPQKLLQLSQRQIKILLDALVLGDGHKSQKTGQLWYNTTSKKLADNVQEMLFKIGISGTIGLKKELRESYIKGRLIRSVKKCYVVSSNNKQNTPLLRKSIGGHIKEVHYKGYVYCCEVSSHILYVRRNGRSVWCGNSRGCPSQCTFCDRSVFGNYTRQRDPINVVDEMQELVEVYGAKEIKFYDDTFTINPKRVLQICDEIKKRKLNVTWSCLTRVSNVNKEILEAMHSSGCWHVLYGIENGNQHMLDYIKKGTNLNQISDAVRWAKEAGLNVRGSFICGLPGETKETIENTVKFALGLGLDEANFYTLVLYPGNELYHMLKKEGKIRHENYKDYNPLAYDDNAVLAYVPEGMEEKELKSIIKKAHRRFYFRPAYIARQVMQIRSKEDVKRYWYAAKALFKLNYASG